MTTINISGNSNDSNLILGSANANIADDNDTKDDANVLALVTETLPLTGKLLKCNIVYNESLEFYKAGPCKPLSSTLDLSPSVLSLYTKLVNFNKKLWEDNTVLDSDIDVIGKEIYSSVNGLFAYLGNDSTEQMTMYDTALDKSKVYDDFGFSDLLKGRTFYEWMMLSQCQCTYQNSTVCCAPSPNCDLKANIGVYYVMQGYRVSQGQDSDGSDNVLDISAIQNRPVTYMPNNYLVKTAAGFPITSIQDLSGYSVGNFFDDMINKAYHNPDFGVDVNGRPRVYLCKIDIAELANKYCMIPNLDAELLKSMSERCCAEPYCNTSVGLWDVADPLNTESSKYISCKNLIANFGDICTAWWLLALADNMFWYPKDPSDLTKWGLCSKVSPNYNNYYKNGVLTIGGVAHKFNDVEISGPDMIPAPSARPDSWPKTDLRAVNIMAGVFTFCCTITAIVNAQFLEIGRALLECGCNCTDTPVDNKPLKWFSLPYGKENEQVDFATHMVSNTVGMFYANVDAVGLDGASIWNEIEFTQAVNFIKIEQNKKASSKYKDILKQARITQLVSTYAKLYALK